MKKMFPSRAFSILVMGFCLLNSASYAHDGQDEIRQTLGLIDMRMGNTQKMMLSNLGHPDPDYDLRYMALLIAQEKTALKLSQEASKSALKPEVKQLALQQASEHATRIEQLETKVQQWFNQ